MSKFYFLLLFLGVVVLSCETVEVKEDLLFGRWTLTEGFRNNEESNMLEGIYFNIESPSTVTSNFLGAKATGTFILDKNDMTVDMGRKTKFEITQLTDNTLELETIIRGIPFRFVLEKNEYSVE